MESNLKSAIWSQFGAAIDMLENALVACPEELWSDRSQRTEFWYTTYHALFWLDLYLTGSMEGFAPPAPFTLSELEAGGVLPERIYSKAELYAYLRHARKKGQITIEGLTEERAAQRCVFRWVQLSFLELLFYSMRHVQEHASQLSLILGDITGSAPDWVTKTQG